MDLTFAKIDAAELRSELQGLDRLAQSFGRSLTGAFLSAAADGRKLSDVLRSLMLSLSRQALSLSASAPCGSSSPAHCSGVIANGQGNVIAGRSHHAFRQGRHRHQPAAVSAAWGLGLAARRARKRSCPGARGADGGSACAAVGGRSPSPSTSRRPMPKVSAAPIQVAATMLARASSAGKESLTMRLLSRGPVSGRLIAWRDAAGRSGAPRS